MSAVGTVTITWRNGEDQFCLARTGDILALEEKCNAGIATIIKRLRNDDYYLNDVRETIRLALIGGGMTPDKAMTAVKLHVDGHPDGLAASVLLAQVILMAVMVGVPGDELGKPKAAEAETGQASSETMAASAAQQSLASEPPSDGIHAKPTTLQSGSLPPASRDMPGPTTRTPTSPIL